MIALEGTNLLCPQLQIMDINIESVTPSKRSGYRQNSIDFKRMVVEQSLLAGASLSRVARAHDVNANQVFSWRKLFRAGAYEVAPGKPVKLLPVVLGKPPQPSPAKPVLTTAVTPTGVMVPEIGKARLRLEGVVNPSLLSMVLARLPA